jgi:hypothetical protein
MSNPCINTRLIQTLEGKVFSYTISYSNIATTFSNPGYTDTITVSGAADCGQIMYTVTDITGADYSKYMTFTADGRTNTVKCTVFTTDGSLVGIHKFKVRATLQSFPSLAPIVGIDNFFSVSITSVCNTDVILRPLFLPQNITTTIDSPPSTYNFQFVQDSVSTNAGFTALTDSGGLCGPWNFDIRLGNFYKNSFAFGYVEFGLSPQGLSTVAPGRNLVIDGKKDIKYVGKHQIFLTITSSVYTTVTNDFEVNIWVYSYCDYNSPLYLP